jgi:hypothetical protein
MVSLSLQGVGTRSDGGVINGLTARRMGRDRDRRNRDVTLKAGDG